MGYKVAPSTVWQILQDTGVDPVPRRSGRTWRAFLAAQAMTILVVDFPGWQIGCAADICRLGPYIFHSVRRVE